VTVPGHCHVVAWAWSLYFDIALRCGFMGAADTFFKNIALLTEVASFLVLKHRSPDRPRPYVVPGAVMPCASTPCVVA
jgi:hypothetical protein